VNERLARAWFAATALAVLAGLVIQVFVTAAAAGGFFHTPAGRVLNIFAFFTIDSNVIVGVTSLLLALRPRRSSTVFSVARMTGLVAITITGLVYHVALRGLFDLDSWALAADVILHTVVPVLAVLGWLCFGPAKLASRRIAVLSLAFPVAWLAFTLSRGAAIGWYPYPFIDVTKIGYLKAIINAVWVAVLFLGVAAGATALDRRLPGRSPGEPAR
jgi:hypothetical protein